MYCAGLASYSYVTGSWIFIIRSILFDMVSPYPPFWNTRCRMLLPADNGVISVPDTLVAIPSLLHASITTGDPLSIVILTSVMPAVGVPLFLAHAYIM